MRYEEILDRLNSIAEPMPAQVADKLIEGIAKMQADLEALAVRIREHESKVLDSIENIEYHVCIDGVYEDDDENRTYDNIEAADARAIQARLDNSPGTVVSILVAERDLDPTTEHLFWLPVKVTGSSQPEAWHRLTDWVDLACDPVKPGGIDVLGVFESPEGYDESYGRPQRSYRTP